MNDPTFDRLIDEAAIAQYARESDEYKAAQADLAKIDTDLENLKARREQACALLEGFETAIESTKDALMCHIAANYLDAADEPTESDDALFGPSEDETPAKAEMRRAFDAAISPSMYEPQVFASDDGQDEFSTPRAAGALND